MNIKKKTMTITLIHMLNSNFKFHSSSNISASTWDNMVDIDPKWLACFYNVGSIHFLPCFLYYCLQGLQTCMTYGIWPLPSSAPKCWNRKDWAQDWREAQSSLARSGPFGSPRISCLFWSYKQVYPFVRTHNCSQKTAVSAKEEPLCLRALGTSGHWFSHHIPKRLGDSTVPWSNPLRTIMDAVCFVVWWYFTSSGTFWLRAARKLAV